MTELEKKTEMIRRFAVDELGFDACGFAKVQRLDKEAFQLEDWLNQNRNGQLDWMANHFDKRINPAELVPGAKSVVSVIASYHFPEHKEQSHYHFPEKKGNYQANDKPKIAKYAQGRDYHKVFKKKLFELFAFTKEVIGNIEGRCFVDSAPVMDKSWAQKAGLGWQGKNSNILSKGLGSYFFIGEMIIDAVFEYNETPPEDYCGNCTRCLDACPTDAIYEPYKVDASKCISYFTIELKEQIPKEYQEKVGNWLYGCDICQEVCPWNRKVKTSRITDFAPREYLLNHDIDFWEELNLEQYNALFEGSAARRAKFEKFKKNVAVVSQNLKGNNGH